MSFKFNGVLHGRFCDGDCTEPLFGVTVLLYRASGKPAPSDPEPLDAAAIEEKQARLLGSAKADESGAFSVEIGPNSRYESGPVEVDVRCDSVPGLRDNRRKEPVQLTLAEVDPKWEQSRVGSFFDWRYEVPARLWCHVRSLFDAWVICGHLRSCKDKVPIAGVTVKAFDADWLQDDALGSAVTAADGHFRIDYTSAQFRKTPFSPWLNVELAEGPDLYFTVESGGSTLLNEKQADGWQPKRRNVQHCFCVDLCVDMKPKPPYFDPLFTSVGNLAFMGDVVAGTGLTGPTSPVGVGYGFFGTLVLGGLCPSFKAGTSQAMFYRFRVALPGVSDAAAPAVMGPQVTPWPVGSRLILWDKNGDGTLEYVPQQIWLQSSGATPGLPAPLPPGTPGWPPKHVIVPDAAGWIAVDPDAVGQSFQTLLALNSEAVVAGGPGGGSGTAGQPPSTPRNGKKVRVIFETTVDRANAAATVQQTDVAVLLVNNFAEVGELDAQQFHGGGANACSGLDAALDIDFTTDHELMLDWSISIGSAAFSLPGAPVNPSPVASGPTPAKPRGDNGTVHLDISSWPSCSYLVELTTQRKLTNGFSNDPARELAAFTFCICSH
jgi:hypothetical protein